MSKEALEAASWRVLFSRQYLPGIALMAMAVWLHASNSMLTATTMPSAVAEIGGLSYISWAFALYLTGSIAAAAAVSLAVSKFGLRQTMLGATFIYTLGCVACAGAPTFPVLLAGRVVQGIGGGALVALVYVFQDRFFPNHFVPRLVAAISVVWTTAACVGPLIGGAFATWSSWRYAFWAFALQALVLMVGISVLMERDAQRDTNTAAFPVVRLSLLAATIVCVSYAGANPALPTSALFLFLSLAALVAFVARDIAAAAGSMLPRAAFTLTSPVRDGLLATFTLSLTLMAFLTYGPILLIELHGLTPVGAGFVVMLESIGWGVAAFGFSGAPPAIEGRLIRIGSAVIVVGLGGMAAVLPTGPLWAIVIVVLVSSAGFGMMWGFIIKRVVLAAPAADKTRAAAMLPSTQQTGFAIGAALSGLIANALGLSDEMARSTLQDIAFWLFAAFIPVALLGNLLAWRFSYR